jgi:hypothetical protein
MTKMSEEEIILVIHVPQTQHTIHHLSYTTDADHNLHPLLNYLPSSAQVVEQTPSERRNPRTQVHHDDGAAATPSLLEQAGF